MKLLDLNLCIKKDNNNEVIDLISNDNYDVITFQEAMRGLDSGVFERYNSSNIIKEKTGYKNSFFGSLWVARCHKKNGIVARDFGGLTEQGNEIITNYSILSSRNVFYYKNYSIFEEVSNFKNEDHGRAFAESILDVDGKKLQVINVHGIWNEDKLGNFNTINQIKTILSNVRYDIPSIVVGDFNLLVESESIKMFDSKMVNLISKYKISSTRPNFDDGLDKGNVVCDYIFVNDKVKVNDFKVLITDVSDHLPLILDFDI